MHYATSFTTYALELKLQPETEKNVKTYGLIRTGVLHYHSNMTIDDPNDPLGCKPLDKKVLVKDFTWMVSGGVGSALKWQVLKMIKDPTGVDPKGKLYYVEFENNASGEVHDHALGRVYNSYTSLLTIRSGVRFFF